MSNRSAIEWTASGEDGRTILLDCTRAAARRRLGRQLRSASRTAAAVRCGSSA
jgi:hypothetical protein